MQFAHREIFVLKASVCFSWQWFVGSIRISSIITKQSRTSPVTYCFVSLVHIDELCNSMRIGQLYRVLGISAHVHQWPNITCNVEANNIQLWEPQCKAVNSHI